jgi:hypothetical protein
LVEANSPPSFVIPLSMIDLSGRNSKQSTLQSKAQHHEISPLSQFHNSIREIS